MSEIGSGSGSSYPGALDTDNTLEVNSPNAGKTKARAEVANDLAACIIAIQTELGVDPAGSLANVKTFLQTEHEADGTHGSNITAISDGTNTIKTKIIDIGDWNMYIGGGGSGSLTATVAHGLTLAKIRGISATIRKDDDAEYVNFIKTYNGIANSSIGGHSITADATNITLTHFNTGGYFDNNNYNATSFNRGWVIITYVV